MKITLVNCIEDKEYLEKCSISMVKSINQNSQNSQNSQLKEHFIIQPNNNNISEETKNILKDKYKKINLYNPQIDTTINYTNVPVVLDYIIDNISSDYMMYTDLDVIFLKDINLNETDKCILTILNPNELHTNDGETFNELYIKYYKDKLIYNIDSLSKSINTWFVFAHKDHFFWKEYKRVTFELLEIAVKYNLDESFCEEIAASIINELNKDQFEDISDFTDIGFLEVDLPINNKYKCTNKSIIYHYNNEENIEDNLDLTSFNDNEFRDLCNILLKCFSINTVMRVRKLRNEII